MIAGNCNVFLGWSTFSLAVTLTRNTLRLDSLSHGTESNFSWKTSGATPVRSGRYSQCRY
ncbi:hypothetical protein CKO_02106 [Citrobacter koseri ATCC BAA-895]|uniref:Uncharacterized protein n=1 Tax=Citrobacter koseri (strain ATCC BAA-895 / CDC 4225-83 / SGSC4696) TaxID=290338 RepID=A8AIB7_CITK8|nr:hypothetical protein CKO_02106 [Citrobacter koseri ATCC BAA-895]